jgi:beta-lactamase class A
MICYLRQLVSLILLVGLILTSCEKSREEEIKMRKVSETYLTNLKSKLNDYINVTDELIAIAFQDVNRQFYLGINDTISLHAASTMKVPVMMEIFRQAEAGTLKLEDSILIKNEFKSIVDESPYSLDIGEDGGDRLYSMIGSKESIRSLVHEMITYSGNLATNLIIEKVHAENVQKFMESFGAKDIRVLRGVEDIKAYRAGKNNTTTAKDLAIIYQVIYQGKYWRDAYREEMLDILSDQHFRSKIPAKLPADVKVAHKTGSITEIDHDSGIIFPEDRIPYILVVLTSGFEDHKVAQESIADISKMIYEWYMQ